MNQISAKLASSLSAATLVVGLGLCGTTAFATSVDAPNAGGGTTI